MPDIQVVLFDLGGTLLHYEQPPDRTFERLNAAAMRAFLTAAVQNGGRVPDPDLALRAVGRMAAAMEARAKRTLYASTAETVLRDGLEAIGVNLADKPWDAGLAAYYDVISSAATPVTGDARAVLARLTEDGHGLGVVSNTMWAPAIHDADLARFGLLEYLPVRIYSSVAGMVKPHSSIYREALDAFNVAPAEAVFVGDRLNVDVAGPQKIGMRAIRVALPYPWALAPDGPYRVEEDTDITPDATIATIDELPAVLEAWERALELPPS
jgi:putative hydrolase of the HAD superfamily